MKDYTTLLNKIQDRYNPDNLYEVRNKALLESNRSLYDVAKYVRFAMMEVDDSYTQKTIQAGENVKACLRNELNAGIEFEYQGSVMTQTHIRGASDIDVLTFVGKFSGTDLYKVRQIINSDAYSSGGYELENLKRWERSFNPYEGNPTDDLRALRFQCERILQRTYSTCELSKPKSIKITNTHLHRDVDIVVCNRFDSVEYIKGKGDEYRGVEIYDKLKNQRLPPDYPFLSIKRINLRSAETEGRLKRMIRFLKNVRTDSDQDIKLTSFDINAICYDIEPNVYAKCHYMELVRVLYSKLNALSSRENADDLRSVVGDEYIFRSNPDKFSALLKLRDEVKDIYNSNRLLI